MVRYRYGKVPYMYGTGTCTIKLTIQLELQLQVATATTRKSFIFIKENKHLCRKKLSVKLGGALNALLLLPLKLRSSVYLLSFGVSPLVNGSNAEL